MTTTTLTAPRAVKAHRPGLALAIIVTTQLMLVLDATVVNIAIPKIRDELNFSAAGASWLLNAYTLAFGGLMLLGGRAGDILGRRRMFIAGVVLFTAASLLGGLAGSAGTLLAARALQGVAAAMAAPSALALITTTFAEGAARNRALGVFTTMSAAGGSLGLILGGALTSWTSWRWVLFINVPIGIAVALLAPRFVAEGERQRGRFDLPGALTSTLGMTLLVYGFIRAASDGWGDVVALGSLGLAVVLLVGFVAIETRAEAPITPLRLLTGRTRIAGYLSMLLLPAAMFGVFFFVGLFMQDVLHYSPLAAGFAFLPLALAIFAAGQVVPRLIPRFGAKPLLVSGLILLTIGLLWLTRIGPEVGYLAGLFGPLLLLGIGGGLAFVPLTVTILSDVPGSDAGAASGLLQAMQQTGAALGVAILVTVFGAATRFNPTFGVSAALTVAAAFAVCALLLALVMRPGMRPSA